MLKMEYLFCVLAANMALVFGLGDMGDGRWLVQSVEDCDEEDTEGMDFVCEVGVTRRRHNRTLDVFDIDFECNKDVDDTYGAILIISKHVDGGYKEWQVVSDESVERFMKKYAEENFRRALELGNIDPPEFPIKAGKYEIKGFAVDYCEFPDNSMYGTFKAIAKLLKDGESVSCVKCTVQFDDDLEDYQCD